MKILHRCDELNQEISAVEKETRLEAILPDTMSLCDQIELKSKELKQLLEKIEAAGDGAEGGELDAIAESEVFVLQQVRKMLLWLSNFVDLNLCSCRVVLAHDVFPLFFFKLILRRMGKNKA